MIPCPPLLLKHPLACDQKLCQEFEPTEVGERIVRKIVEKGIEIGDAVFQNRDPAGVQSISAVQIIHGTASDDRIKGHQLSFIGIRQPRPTSPAMRIPDRRY